MNKRLRTSSQADAEESSAPGLSLDEHTAVIMSHSVVVERHIQLADFYELRFEEQAGWLPFVQRTGYASKNLVQEFYASILRARDVEEPSMEVTVRNVQIIFSPDKLALFLGTIMHLILCSTIDLKKHTTELSYGRAEFLYMVVVRGLHVDMHHSSTNASVLRP
ncbi:hypothetical protein CJ030_MR7G028043 [Morella rubra]|uniref:Uncharacterized protein n=1 Tax=Morella rubra TaxID=262757 RepID=A0A6A1UZE9_9ROSI|nr:hypothetical protein CJ030_MR7G028043 [Morella rubra]